MQLMLLQNYSYKRPFATYPKDVMTLKRLLEWQLF